MADLDRLVEVLDQDFDVVVATLTPDGFNPEAYQRAYVDSAKTLAAFAIALFLLVLTLGLNIIALRLVDKYKRKYA